MPLSIHTAATPFHPVTRGCGEDVLLLDDLGSDDWGALAERLAANYRVTTFRPRGTGHVPLPPRPWSVSDFVADALTVLDDLGIAHAHLIGSGLGALVAQEIAAAHPARVRTLVVNGSWAGPDVHFEALVGAWIWEARQQSYFADRRGYAATARALRAYDAGSRPAAIDAPTLLTVGELDEVRPPAHTQALAEQIRDSRVEVIAGAGRHPFLDDPDGYGALVERFLASAADTVEVGVAA
jgi:pimeloyl-ACP methyl ester carboxylesterase